MSAVSGGGDREAVSSLTPQQGPRDHRLGCSSAWLPACMSTVGVCVTAVVLKLIAWEVSLHCPQLQVLRWTSFKLALYLLRSSKVGLQQAVLRGCVRKCCLPCTLRTCRRTDAACSAGGVTHRQDLSAAQPHRTPRQLTSWGSLPET